MKWIPFALLGASTVLGSPKDLAQIVIDKPDVMRAGELHKQVGEIQNYVDYNKEQSIRERLTEAWKFILRQRLNTYTSTQFEKFQMLLFSDTCH